MKASGSGAVSAVKISSNSCKGSSITINMDLLVPLEDHAALKKVGSVMECLFMYGTSLAILVHIPEFCSGTALYDLEHADEGRK